MRPALTAGVEFPHPSDSFPPRPLVLIPAPVPAFANLAKCRCHCIVHVVMNRLHSPQVGKDRLEVVISHVAHRAPRHDGIEFSSSNLTRAHGLNKSCFAIVGNPRGVRSNVRGGHSSERTFHLKATRQL